MKRHRRSSCDNSGFFQSAVVATLSMLLDVGLFAASASSPPYAEKPMPQPRQDSADPASRNPFTESRVSLEGEARIVVAAQRVRRAVVRIHDSAGIRGTGFVVSKRHRLVLTAAHVADFCFQNNVVRVNVEGDVCTRRIEKVWFHPRTMRKLGSGLVVRSFTPADGPVTDDGPDMALLQLSDECGSPLFEADLEINNQVPRNYSGCPVGVLGYWGTEDDFRNDTSHRRVAELLATTVLKPEGHKKGSAEQEERFTCSGPYIPGGSGGPVFLGDGHVAGLAFAVDMEALTGHDGVVYVLRVEALRELVTYYKIGELMPVNVTPANQRPDWGPDPRLGEFRRAAALACEAASLRGRGKYNESIEKCNDALKLAPDYAGALLQRSITYMFILGVNWHTLSLEHRRYLSSWAAADSDRARVLDPGSCGAALTFFQSVLYQAFAHSRPQDFRFVETETSFILGLSWEVAPLDDHDKSYFYNLRAQAHHFLGEFAEAERDYEESLRMEPTEPRWYLNRAQYWDQKGRPELAQEDRRNAERVKRAEGNVNQGGQIP